jgi:hypothetical protein
MFVKFVAKCMKLMLYFGILLHWYCCLLHIGVNTVLNAILIFVFHISYYNLQDLRFSRRWLWRIPSSGMWRRDVSEERRFTQDLHGATSQKTAFFLLQLVSASFGHYQVSIILLKLLQCHLSMSRVNASLFLFSSYNQQFYEVFKILKLKLTVRSHAK